MSRQAASRHRSYEPHDPILGRNIEMQIDKHSDTPTASLQAWMVRRTRLNAQPSVDIREICILVGTVVGIIADGCVDRM